MKLKFHAENGFCPSVGLGEFIYFIKEDEYAGACCQHGWELWKRRISEETQLKSIELAKALQEAGKILEAKGINPCFYIPSYYAGARILEEKGHTWCVIPKSDTDHGNGYILRKIYSPQYCTISAPTYADCIKAATEYVNKLAAENDPVQLSFEKER